MSGRLRVGLLFGGASVEHEVSVVSARGVAAALDPARFETVPIGLTGDGRWLGPEASAVVLAGNALRVEPPSPDDGSRLLVDPGAGGIVSATRERPSKPIPIDVVFSVVHGWGGEDGRIQGLLDLAGIPCVGAGVLGSAIGMDKQVAKVLFEERELPVGPWRSLTRERWLADPAASEAGLVEALGLPLFTKPANGGSSVGISKVRDASALSGALDLAFAHDRKVVVESGLDAREIECAVLGNDAPEVSVAGEIVPSREFYDYASKYEDGTSRIAIPAPLDQGVADRVRALAGEAFRALDLSGMARVDFFLEKGTGRVFVNEVNTLPGFTPISMYPKLWEATGLPYPELLARLIELARERFGDERRRRTRRD
jgi:D-alanine-D-alanine ligase